MLSLKYVYESLKQERSVVVTVFLKEVNTVFFTGYSVTKGVSNEIVPIYFHHKVLLCVIFCI